MPSTRAASAGRSPASLTSSRARGARPEPLQRRDPACWTGRRRALLQALDVTRADQPPARDPGQAADSRASGASR